MATTSKKVAKKSKPKPRSSSLKAANAKLLRENKELRRKLQERNRDLTAALEQQTATGEVLRVIASSPTDIKPVLDVCGATVRCERCRHLSRRWRHFQRAAICAPIPMRAEPLRINRGTVMGRTVVDRQAVHVHDMEAESETDF